MNWLAIAVICIFLSACAHRQEPPLVAPPLPEPAEPPPPDLLTKPTDIWKEYDCDNKILPFLIIESQKITPSSPQPGQEFEHRFVYAACVSDAQTPIKGTLRRKLFFQRKLIFQHVSHNVEIRTGKLEHTAKIKIPRKTKPGNYKIQVSFTIPGKAPSKSKDFRFTIGKKRKTVLWK